MQRAAQNNARKTAYNAAAETVDGEEILEAKIVVQIARYGQTVIEVSSPTRITRG